MKISKKRHKKLCDAIYEPIMSLRIKCYSGQDIDIDNELFALQDQIYKEVERTLDLTKTN